MVKGKRRPQGQSKAASSSQPRVISSSNKDHDNASGLSTNSSPKWRDKLYEHWIEVLAGGIFVGLSTGLFFLWLGEYREHESTKAQLARAEGDKRQTEDGRNQAIGERDRLQKELTGLRQENADLKKQHRILDFYGPHAKLTGSYDLPKEVGSILQLGTCPANPCLEFKLREITKGRDGLPLVNLGIGGDFASIKSPDHSINLQMPARRGCRAIFEAGLYQVTFALEEEQFQVLKVGIGISAMDRPRDGFSPGGYECPER